MKIKLDIARVVVASALSVVAVTLAIAWPVSATVPGINTEVSVDPSGNEGNGNSGLSGFGTGTEVTKNGKYVVFNSKASNLVLNDTNGKQDVFVRDLSSNITTRISVSSSGVEANADSELMAVSETGRYVVFRSTATNLIDNQTYSNYQIYIHDMKTGSTNILVANGGSPWTVVTGISNDARFAVVETVNTNNHVYLLDVASQTWTQLDAPISGTTQQSVDSGHSAMSCDGSVIVFDSAATNLVSGDTNGHKDVFVVDLRNGIKLTDLTANGDDDSVDPRISCNGDFIGFASKATTFVSGVSSGNAGHYYRYDRLNDSYVLLDQTTDGTISSADSAMSNDGSSPQISDAGDAVYRDTVNMTMSGGGTSELYFRNVDAGTTETLTQTSTGTISNQSVVSPYITADGKLVTFTLGGYNSLLDYNNLYSAAMFAETGL
jgi:hypothetical protein